MADNSNAYPADGKKNYNRKGGMNSAIYFMGFIGALIHYFQHVATAGSWILAVVKAIIWPAMLVYDLMEYLKM